MKFIEMWDYSGKNSYGKARAIAIGKYTFYFSYDTIVGFSKEGELAVCENVWTNTTGKHLNALEKDKSKRLKIAEFQKQLKETLAEINAKQKLPIQLTTEDYEAVK